MDLTRHTAARHAGCIRALPLSLLVFSGCGESGDPIGIGGSSDVLYEVTSPLGSVAFQGGFFELVEQDTLIESMTPYSRVFRVKNEVCGTECTRHTVVASARSPSFETASSPIPANPLTLCLTNTRTGERRCDSGTRLVDLHIEL